MLYLPIICKINKASVEIIELEFSMLDSGRKNNITNSSQWNLRSAVQGGATYLLAGTVTRWPWLNACRHMRTDTQQEITIGCSGGYFEFNCVMEKRMDYMVGLIASAVCRTVFRIDVRPWRSMGILIVMRNNPALIVTRYPPRLWGRGEGGSCTTIQTEPRGPADPVPSYNRLIPIPGLREH